MTTRLTSSMVVAQAIGLSPDGIPASKDGNCAFCGAEIKIGDLQVPFSAGLAFMDDLSLAARGSDMTCGSCVHCLSAEGLRKTSHGVFSESGFRPFRKWKEVTASLLDPPAPPFVMLYATANNQHMAWRAPVNYSRDLFYVRVGLRDLKIRRPKLEEAVGVCARVAVAMGRDATSRGKTLPHPFPFSSGLSSDLKSPLHGDLSEAINKPGRDGFAHLKDDAQYQADLAFLMRLTLGETWALRFVLTPTAGEAAGE